MENKIRIRQISKIIKRIDIKKFVRKADRFLTACRNLNNTVMPETGESRPPEKKKRIRIIKKYEAEFEKFEKQAADITSASSDLMELHARFPFVMNGQKTGNAQIDEKTIRYLKKMRDQQTELLFTIDEEISIMKNMILFSERIRSVVHSHWHTLDSASNFLDLMQERMEHRPNPLLLQSAMPDPEIKQLCDESNDSGRKKPDLDQVSKPFAEFRRMTIDAADEINFRKQALVQNAKELRQGWNCLKRLVKSGYSPQMQTGMDQLYRLHDQRKKTFDRFIKESRKTWL
ncbi:hypothetical protein QUF76_12930 [Desulfobacterales bacterium HSG16]|nr:hypothetical protein [Desulfobacterales bacterium HSG16]